MNHYEGLTPDQRWKNDVLRELLNLNRNIEKLIEQQNQEKRTRKGRDNGTTSG